MHDQKHNFTLFLEDDKPLPNAHNERQTCCIFKITTSAALCLTPAAVCYAKPFSQTRCGNLLIAQPPYTSDNSQRTPTADKHPPTRFTCCWHTPSQRDLTLIGSVTLQVEIWRASSKFVGFVNSSFFFGFGIFSLSAICYSFSSDVI